MRCRATGSDPTPACASWWRTSRRSSWTSTAARSPVSRPSATRSTSSASRATPQSSSPSPDPRSSNKRLWIVRRAATTASPIGDGRDVAVAADRAGIWVTRLVSRRHCALLRIGIDGRRSAARAIPCAWIIAPAGTLGLVVHRTQIIDPRTRRKVFGTKQGVLAVAGRRVLLAGGVSHSPGYRFTLLDTATATPAPIRVAEHPRRTRRAGCRSARAAIIAIPFADPSWHNTGRQVLDVWVLDTVTARLTHLPARPPTCRSSARASRGRTTAGSSSSARRTSGPSSASGARDRSALSLKTVRLPVRDGASDAFAPLR